MHRAVLKTLAAAMLLLSLSSPVFAQGQGRAVYMGGTVNAISDKARGRIDLKNEEKLVFTSDKAVRVEIPWSSVDEVEYGQKAGRRAVMAVAISPVALFTKNRKHYVTMSWKDADGKGQSAVFQLDKNDIRPALSIIKVRTGKTIAYTDEEAQKQMGGDSDRPTQQSAARDSSH